MHVQACCCQSSWLKHPFVQKQGEMQCHCSGSSQSHTTPLCSVPFVGLWGEEEAPLWIAGNNALLTGNQRNTCTSWQYPASGSEVGICINGGRKTHFLHMWEARCAHWREKRSLIIKAAAAAPLAQRQTLLTEQVCSGCAAQGSLLMAGRRQHPAAALILTDLVPGSAHKEEIKELLECWEQPERQKDSCFSMSVCFRAGGDIRDFGPSI